MAFCDHVHVTKILDTATMIIMTLLLKTILTTLNLGDFIYNDSSYNCIIKWVALFKLSLLLKIDLESTQTLQLN